MISRTCTKNRRRHRPTSTSREHATFLLAAGWSEQRVASAFGISESIFRKHYAPEIAGREAASARLMAELIWALWLKARRGQIGAIRQMHALLEATSRPPPAAARARKPVCKNARLAKAAHAPIGSWQDELTPAPVSDNDKGDDEDDDGGEP